MRVSVTGLELEDRRKAMGMTQLEFARHMGVDPRTLRRLEKQKFSSIPEYHARLATYLFRYGPLEGRK